jgi:hypothetical protein
MTPKSRQIPPKDEVRRVSTLALIDVASDRTAPAAARAAAARTLLESLGDIGRLQEIARAAERPLNELSLQELDEEIAKARVPR